MMQNDISVQGWSSQNPYNYSAWNANWPIEALDSIPGSAEDRQIDLNDLMPAGWRMGANVGSGQQLVTGGINDESGWNATVPSREQYERYNLTAGSARLAQ